MGFNVSYLSQFTSMVVQTVGMQHYTNFFTFIYKEGTKFEIEEARGTHILSRLTVSKTYVVLMYTTI